MQLFTPKLTAEVMSSEKYAPVMSRYPWIVRGDHYRRPQPVQDAEEGRAENARNQRQ